MLAVIANIAHLCEMLLLHHMRLEGDEFGDLGRICFIVLCEVVIDAFVLVIAIVVAMVLLASRE